jgi:hypothetical protein
MDVDVAARHYASRVTRLLFRWWCFRLQQHRVELVVNSRAVLHWSTRLCNVVWQVRCPWLVEERLKRLVECHVRQYVSFNKMPIVDLCVVLCVRLGDHTWHSARLKRPDMPPWKTCGAFTPSCCAGRTAVSCVASCAWSYFCSWLMRTTPVADYEIVSPRGVGSDH